MDESVRLESEYGRNVILGSNPSPTALRITVGSPLYQSSPKANTV